ncbi:hypothetical protein [Halalkalibacter krulwichiae]|uniref:hypothetical protein n=1 Tax=Halalkalibacter krulwichiae TaxID=199441 RepID=UPI00147138E2|nr:hypothetical protein [Halalkalibacter krulwichiae]
MVSVVDSHTDAGRKVLVLVVPGMSFNEAEWLIEHDQAAVWKESTFGAMNVRPDGPYSYLNNMVSIASGAKAVGVQEWNSYEADEHLSEKGFTASEWMYQLTGISETDGLVHPHMHRLQRKNNESTHKAQVGVFGELLMRNNIDRQVFGHSDTSEEKVRYGSLLALDRNGIVSGDFSESVQKQAGTPFGLEMNHDYLMHKLSTDVDDSQFFVVEWGDLYRLFEQQSYMEEKHFEVEWEKRLQHLSTFVSDAQMYADEIWVIAPMMNKQAYDEKKQLAPVFYWGDQEKRGGFLTSNTTKQDYLVSSIDLIPTWLSSFGLADQVKYSGNVIKQTSVGEFDKSPVLKRVDEMVLIYKSRARVLSIYISCLVIALITAALYGFFGTRKRQLWRYITRLILLSALWSPFWFLALAGFVDQLGIAGFVLALIGGSFVSGFLVEKFSQIPIFLIGSFTFLLITIDISLGSPLMQRSYLGYDPIIGARYYGIGNEFAGVYLISAFMILQPALAGNRRKVTVILIAAMSTILTIVLGKSTLGTNAGATLAAGLAFSFLLYRVIFQSVSWKRVVFLCGGVVSVLFLFLYMLQLTGEQTHIGVAFERLLDGDFLYIKDIIQRKMAMNLKIFRHSNWTQLFVTSYLLGAVILWRKRLQLEGQEKQLFLQTGVVSSFALLLLNDSGVVAAATSMFCVVSAHYYWLSAKKEENHFDVGKTVNSSQTVED